MFPPVSWVFGRNSGSHVTWAVREEVKAEDLYIRQKRRQAHPARTFPSYTDWVLAQFSNRRNTARKKFREFIREGYGEGRKEESHRGTKEGRILGSDEFFEEVLALRGEKVGSQVTLDQILERACHSYGVGVESLASAGRQHHLSEVRAMISWIVRETKHLFLMELSHRLNRDISSLNVSARRLVEKSQLDSHLRRKMEELKSAFLKN